MRITVSIVEDDHGIRDTLGCLVANSEGFRLGAALSSAEAALRTIPRDPPDVVLMDINLPGIDGVECVRRLKVLTPAVQFIMLTVHEDGPHIFAALAAGATGYLVKGSPTEELLQAIRDVQIGGSPMSNQIARRVVQSFHKMGPAPEAPQNLTEREEQVLRLLAQGYIYKEIGDTLGISIETVRTHIRKTYEKLHVRTRTEAVAKLLSR